MNGVKLAANKSIMMGHFTCLMVLAQEMDIDELRDPNKVSAERLKGLLGSMSAVGNTFDNLVYLSLMQAIETNTASVASRLKTMAETNNMFEPIHLTTEEQQFFNFTYSNIIQLSAV